MNCQRPHTYLTRQRLLLVRDLLLRSEESVTAACYRVGFACSLVVLSVFCRAPTKTHALTRFMPSWFLGV